MTSKEIKTSIVYNEEPEGMTPEERFNYDAFSALWERMKSVFINDEDLEPVNPNKN